MSDDNGRPDSQPEHDSTPAASTPATPTTGDTTGSEQRPVSAERTTKRIQWMSAAKPGTERPEPEEEAPAASQAPAQPASPVAAQPSAPQPQPSSPQVHHSGPQQRVPQSISPNDGMPRVHYNAPQPQQPQQPAPHGAPGQPPVHHSGPQPRIQPGQQQWNQGQPQSNVQYQRVQPRPEQGGQQWQNPEQRPDNGAAPRPEGAQPPRHDSGPVQREQQSQHDSGPVRREQPPAPQPYRHDSGPVQREQSAAQPPVRHDSGPVRRDQAQQQRHDSGPVQREQQDAQQQNKPAQQATVSGAALFQNVAEQTETVVFQQLPATPRPAAEQNGQRSAEDAKARPAPRPEQATTFARPVGDAKKAEPQQGQATTFVRPVGQAEQARPGGDLDQSTNRIDQPTKAVGSGAKQGADRVDQPTTAVRVDSLQQATNRIDQATSAIRPQGLGSGRPIDPESDTVRIPKIDAATTAAPTAVVPPAKATAVFNAKPPTPPTPPIDSSTTIHPLPEDDEDEPKAGRRKKVLLAAASVIGLFGVLYVGDLLLSQGTVPRGVTVAGVDVGGMDRTSAERKLREQIEPRLGKPVALRVGDVDTEVSPQEAGLAMNWQGTLDQAGEQSYNPFTRIASFFTTTELGVITSAEESKVSGALEHLREITDRLPAEGTIAFTDGRPKPIDPKPGQKLDAPAAIPVLKSAWASGTRVALPVVVEPVVSTPEGVRKALEEVAKPAVSGPLTVLGEGGNATVPPVAIGNAMRFESDGKGGLAASLDVPKVAEVARPQLASTDKPGKDAEIVIEGGKPVVKPSTDGRGVDWEKTLAGALEVLRKPQDRQIKATYSQLPAKLTTEQANALGVKQLVAEFETKGFAADSGRNIKRAAEQINGAIVKPGETFSMNGRTGPRTAATGYVEAAIIEKGELSRAVGGGVSQMATTLYNAAYFAGMVDVAHKEHSFYISRYPKGREATVFQNPNGSSVIDVKFKNDTKTGILIQTIWTSNSITVKMWGTKTYEVTSQTSGEFAQTAPQVKEIPYGQPCTASSGSGGFSVKDTRTIKDLATGHVRREDRTVRYNPQHKVVCGAPPAGG
ncbi:VanW family protein [Allokutzneria oryzae]|uniref:VanW family protein n=1 Tax=Allokutzneria oryzae TaxID=1378989 RepID=A0ABV6A4H2_9PSEU